MTREIGILILWTCALVAASASAADAVDVLGWPLPSLTGDVPGLEIGDDPIYGRQVCPPLTRLNLAQKRSEELLLRKVTAVEQDAGAMWRLELRPGTFWWDGSRVTAADIGAFLQTDLERIVKARGGGVWQVPKFAVAEGDGGDVLVHWHTPPAFGPYVLSGAPFYRRLTSKARSDTAYECAGLYRPQQEPYGIALVPTPGYHFRRPLPEIHIYKDGALPPSRGKRQIALRYASSVSGQPAKRAPDAGAGCQHTLDLQLATMIVWNLSKAPTADKAFRRVLTQLIPRGTLANAGAASLADVASSPVPREHPGYDPRVTTRPFDIQGASAALNLLGFRRKTADAPRLNAAGEPLKLTLLSPNGSTGLAEKVIIDAYSAVGIAVQFKPEAATNEAVDGVLAAFALDWPRANFLGNFHSGVTTAPFWPLGDPELDRDLEAYAASLTTATPNFAELATVHKRLAELEPLTVLLQHKACVDVDSAFKLAKGVVNQRDPDWFRQLLF